MSLFPFRCSACGTVHYINRALAVECPVEACKAKVGQPCRDLRTKEEAGKTRLQPHPEREALLP